MTAARSSKSECPDLTNSERNHGEDAKEYYFCLDSTRTHFYFGNLYKDPLAACPCDNLVTTNRERILHAAKNHLETNCTKDQSQ